MGARFDQRLQLIDFECFNHSFTAHNTPIEAYFQFFMFHPYNQRLVIFWIILKPGLYVWFGHFWFNVCSYVLMLDIYRSSPYESVDDFYMIFSKRFMLARKHGRRRVLKFLAWTAVLWLFKYVYSLRMACAICLCWFWSSSGPFVL